MDISRLDPTARRSIRRLLDDPTFEMIPLSNATEQASYLPEGARISVTASPNKTLDDSLDLAAELCQAGYRVTPHLSARMSRDMAHVEHLLHRMEDLALTSAFVVGGDPDPVGDFHDGVSLLEAMDRVGHSLAIGVPCYPENHPDIPEDELWSALEAKQGYAAWMTSQMCFDADALRKWGINARQRGVDLPLVLGLPGAADRMKLLRISTRIGVGRSLSFLRKNTGLVSAFVKPGGYDPAELLIDIGDDLADPTLDIVGCHIYTFNQCDTTEEWRQRVMQALA